MDPSLWPSIIESKILYAYALFVWGTVCEAPFTEMKIIPEKICSNPECCLSVNHGLLNKKRDTKCKRVQGQVILSLSKYQQREPQNPMFQNTKQLKFFFKSSSNREDDDMN